MASVIYDCPCGRMSDPCFGSEGPRGWFVGRIYFNGMGRILIACSADCINAERERTKKHYREETERFARRIDELRFERIK